MKIGVTGVIGSGKSTVMNIIKSFGYNTFDSDEFVHNIYQKQEVINLIAENFECVVDNQIDRNLLGKIIFNDESKRELLNSIVHPLVINEVERLEGLVFVDVPLLYESGMENFFDKIIVVSASFEIIIERVMLRNNFTKEQVLQRLNTQIDLNTKQKLADYVIINNSSISVLENNIKRILEEINV